MKIAFLISGSGIFGSVREIVEIGNTFIDNGNECFIFNPQSDSISWLEFKGQVKFLEDINNHQFDVLILTTTPTDFYLDIFNKAKSKVKIFCFMGFNETQIVSDKNINFIFDNYYIAADGMWQYFKLQTLFPRGKFLFSQLGGINQNMFFPIDKAPNQVPVIGISGDPRPRKGSLFITDYLKNINIKYETYFGKNIKQKDMHNWFANIDIFIDNHQSGGWCNPVAEAMACKKIVLCSNTPCNSDFAFHNLNCFKFNNEKDFNKYFNELYINYKNYIIFAHNGHNFMQKFNYNIIGLEFLNKLKNLIS